MKTRIIYTKIWKDDYFSNLDTIEKLMFIYLVTNERVNLTGMYELTIREIKFDTGITDPIKILTKFHNDKKFIYTNGWIKILNYEKYNNYAGGKNEIAIERELSLIPDEVKEYTIDTVSPKLDTPNNHKSKIIKRNVFKQTIVGIETSEILDHYRETYKLQEIKNIKSQIAAIDRMLKIYSKDQIKKSISDSYRVKDKKYYPLITNLLDLEEKWDKLNSLLDRENPVRKEKDDLTIKSSIGKKIEEV